jgi:hypothetical protein
VGGSEAKKGPGSDLFSDVLFVVLLDSRSSPRNAQGRDKKVREKVGDPRGGWVGQRPKKHRGKALFSWCFWTPIAEKPPETAIKQKIAEEKPTSKFLPIFWGKSFRHGLFTKKKINGVFVLLLPRNAQKCTKKKAKEEQNRQVGG